MDNKLPGTHHDSGDVVSDVKGHPDARQGDEALQALEVSEQQHLEIDAANAKRIRRRADMIIMPVSHNLTRDAKTC